MATESTATFAEHIGELRRRLMWSLLFVGIGAGIGYVLHDRLLVLLQQPLNQTLYYTNPTGAFSFIIKVCTVFGLVVALPVMTYNGFAFFGPLIQARTKRIFLSYVFISVLLALLGIAFAYFISLPAALHFLVNFGGEDIKSLITANEYFNFVLAYLAGFALLFQLPLILSFINRLTPLTPSKLVGGTRYVILGSFIVAAIITPTPDPLNQLLMAGPVILLYFLSASFIAIKNRSLRHEAKEERPVTETYRLAPTPQPAPTPVKAPVPSFQPVSPKPTAVRRVNDIIVPGRNISVPAYQRRQPGMISQQRSISSKPRLISDFIPAPE